MLTVIVPLYNEASSLPTFMKELHAHLVDSCPRYRCLLVDDGSADRTWEVVQELRKTYPIEGLRLSRNFGKEAALCAGLELAEGEVFVTIDGDLQHPPDLIPRMLEVWKEEECDLVEAVKKRDLEESKVSRLQAKLFYIIFNLLCGKDLEGQTDFKLLTSRARDAWLRLPERSIFFRGITHWLGFKRGRVEFSVPHIPGRDSRWTFLGLMRYAIKNITAFSSVPLTLLFVTGCLFFIPATLLTAWVLYQKLTGLAVTGFATVIILILASGGLNFIGLSVLGLYVARIYEEVKARPRYILRDRF